MTSAMSPAVADWAASDVTRQQRIRVGIPFTDKIEADRIAQPQLLQPACNRRATERGRAASWPRRAARIRSAHSRRGG